MFIALNILNGGQKVAKWAAFAHTQQNVMHI